MSEQPQQAENPRLVSASTKRNSTRRTVAPSPQAGQDAAFETFAQPSTSGSVSSLSPQQPLSNSTSPSHSSSPSLNHSVEVQRVTSSTNPFKRPASLKVQVITVDNVPAPTNATGNQPLSPRQTNIQIHSTPRTAPHSPSQQTSPAQSPLLPPREMTALLQQQQASPQNNSVVFLPSSDSSLPPTDLPPSSLPPPLTNAPFLPPPNDLPPCDLPPNDLPPNDLPPNNLPPNDLPPNDLPPNDLPPPVLPPLDLPPTDYPPAPSDLPPSHLPPSDLLPPTDIPVPLAVLRSNSATATSFSQPSSASASGNLSAASNSPVSSPNPTPNANTHASALSALTLLMQRPALTPEEDDWGDDDTTQGPGTETDGVNAVKETAVTKLLKMALEQYKTSGTPSDSPNSARATTVSPQTSSDLLSPRSGPDGHKKKQLPSVPKKKQTKEQMEANRFNVLTEIWVAEQRYHADLTVLLELRGVMVQYSNLIEEFDVEACLDSSLEKIASSSEVILKHLEERMSGKTNHDGSTICVGHIFQYIADFLLNYSPYINKYDTMSEEFYKLRFSNVKLNDTIKKFLFGKGKKLEDILILPIQRIPQYIIQLKHLLESTAHDSEDFTKLTNAIIAIQEITKTLNDEKKLFDKQLIARKIFTEVGKKYKPHVLFEAEEILLHDAAVTDSKEKYKIVFFNDKMFLIKFTVAETQWCEKHAYHGKEDKETIVFNENFHTGKPEDLTISFPNSKLVDTLYAKSLASFQSIQYNYNHLKVTAKQVKTERKLIKTHPALSAEKFMTKKAARLSMGGKLHHHRKEKKEKEKKKDKESKHET